MAPADVSAAPVKYGDKIKLWAETTYKVPETLKKKGGYLGYFDKKGKHGILTAVPPIGPHYEASMFTEEVFTVLDPFQKCPSGSALRYGQEVVLVNQDGQVWNNKTGGITGYIGPRPAGAPGSLQVTFENAGKAAGEPVCYGDANVAINVSSSNRHLNMFNKRLTNFKKETSKTVGGYICSDGKGNDFTICIHPDPPELLSAKQVKAFHKAEWGRKITFDTVNGALIISFSNKSYIKLAQERLEELVSAEDRTLCTLPLQDGPGSIVFSLESSPADQKQIIETTRRRGGAGGEEVPSSSRMLIGVLFFTLPLGLYLTGHISFIITCATFLMGLVSSLSLLKPKPKQAQVDNVSMFFSTEWKIVLQEWTLERKQAGPSHSAIPEVPQRFIAAEKGNKEKAAIRWKATLAWRKQNKVDGILTEPMPYFKVIKKYYPHYFCGRSKNNNPIYYEKPGKIQFSALEREGVTMQHMLRHYIMLTEFLWQRLEPSETGRTVTVLDVEGIGVKDFAGQVVEFIRGAIAFTGAHYPERSACIFIINVPGWFSVVWNTVKAWVDPVTREKVFILRGKDKIREALLSKIDEDVLPAEYGGKNTLDPQQSEEEKLLAAIAAFANGEGPDPLAGAGKPDSGGVRKSVRGAMTTDGIPSGRTASKSGAEGPKRRHSSPRPSLK